MEKKLVHNIGASNHLHVIKDLIKSSDELWLATAFLKMSGLNLLLPLIKKHVKASKPILIIAGQNFGLTDPEALKTLFQLFKNQINAHLFIDKAADKSKVFHPKLFLFRTKDTGFIVSGSANITAGGLISNQEVSIHIQTDTSSKEWENAITYFNHITSEENASSVNLMLIKRYEQFYKEQKGIRKYQKAIPKKQETDFEFDYRKLKAHLREYRSDDSYANFEQRKLNYKEAKQLLQEISDNSRLSQNRFEEIIDSLVGSAGYGSLWQSGSLFRQRFKVYECKNEFQNLVKFVIENKKKPTSAVFSGAKELVKKVNGASINYATEIMATIQPNRFAILNRNPITVLDQEAGVYFKSHSSSFNGNDYAEYCLLIREITEELDLENMLEADSFFNEIYWEIKND
ncbi:hypothetical protein I5168_11495 [Nonlabens sp. SCSIO 43208]|uniref:phospholipase D-like domain-containing protein n=1 Tax=Nonlabens sp. SCSIO 43208 TaxID=2793009 RepID=UPI003D6B258F